MGQGEKSAAAVFAGPVLVTGASTGIGRATVLRLARSERIVFGGVRNERDAAALVRDAGPNVRPLLLDVTDARSIAAARDAVASAGLPLAALINNAGISVAGPLEILPRLELRRQFDVNFFGAIEVTQAFLGQLRDTRGRIVNVSSITGKLATPFIGAYAASKFALEAASDALRLELRPFGIHVALIEPGAIKTPIWQRSTESANRILGAIAGPARESSEGAMDSLRRVSSGIERQAIEPDVVARAIERALGEKRPRARYLVGRDARVQLGIARLPECVRDRIVTAALGIG